MSLQVILNTSFKPATSSTQASYIPKRVCEDLEKEDSKKLKRDEDSNSVANKSLAKGIQNQICIDVLTSPNRVIKRKFPGPAGLLLEMGANNKSILQILENEKLKNDNIEDVSIYTEFLNIMVK